MDDKIISRIGGTFTDYLVFFGVAFINIPVIVKYAVPFTLLMLVGVAGMLFLLLFFSPRLVKTSWLEKGFE